MVIARVKEQVYSEDEDTLNHMQPGMTSGLNLGQEWSSKGKKYLQGLIIASWLQANKEKKSFFEIDPDKYKLKINYV